MEHGTIGKTIEDLEGRITRAGSIRPEDREELLKLLAQLRSEVVELSKTHAEDAESISGFARVSTHEATRQEKNPELLRLSLEGLSSSVTGFEKSHPKLVDIVNRVALTLSNLGI